MQFGGAKKRIYLDYASATPVRKEVIHVMKPFFSEVFGNAGSIHQEGVTAGGAISVAREKLARLLHVRTEGIVFTGSGTESNNLALLGVVSSLYAKGVAYADMHVVSTRIEHASILEVLSHFSSLGVTVVYADVLATGLIDTKAFEKLITPQTILVACAYVNSEIGVIQPINKLARIIRASEKKFGTKIVFHVDAAQAPLWLSCSFDAVLCDTMALDAGKCYGPKGVGVLARRHGVELTSPLYGGNQENGLRPGTENTPLIVGAVEAITLAQQGYEQRSVQASKLRDAFIEMLETIEGVVVNGHKTERVANNINISVDRLDAEYAVISLDEAGVACSTKSACGGARGDGSSVVRSITGDNARALSTIRFSLGEDTTQRELTQVTKLLREHVDFMRTSLKN